MNCSDFYDIIILGSGISSLLLASELSKNHSVLIIEQECKIPKNKYWLTNVKCIEYNDNLTDCIDTYYNSLDYIAYNGDLLQTTGKYILWNTDKLLNSLSREILKNNGIFLTSSRFYGYKELPNRMLVFAGDKQLYARIIIDCMGYSSPIVYSKDIIDIKGYYILYGALLRLKKEINPIGLHNIFLDSKIKCLEIFPTKDYEMAYVTLIMINRNLKPTDYLSKDFEFIIKESSYKHYFSEEPPVNMIHGIVPVGRFKKTSLNRVFFFGESKQVNPAASATGFTRMLHIYKATSQFISKQLFLDKLSGKELENIQIDSMNIFVRKLQLNLFSDILNWKSDDFLKFIIQLKNLNSTVPGLLDDIIFAELELNQILNFDTITSLIKNKNTMLLELILKSLFY